MKFTTQSVAQGVTILANDHYVAIPYNCAALSALATDGVIKEGTVIPANDATAVGVLLNPVVLAENPNGTIVIHGFIKSDKLPAHLLGISGYALTEGIRLIFLLGIERYSAERREIE